MRFFTFCTAILISSIAIQAQTPTNVRFELTNNGLLIPRYTEIQKNAIAAPEAGLIIYQTTAPKGLYYFDGTS